MAVIEDKRRLGAPADLLSSCLTAYSESGFEGFLRLCFDPTHRRHKPLDVAAHYALIGEKDLAFEWLEKAYQLPLSWYFFADARFDSLHDDARYKRLLRKLNLPEEAIARHLAQ